MRHISILLTFLLLLSGMAFSQSRLAKTLTDAKKMKDANNIPLALAKYQQALSMDPDNFEALWNASLFSASMGRQQNDESVRDKYFIDAKRLAEKAIRTNPNIADGYYALAVALDEYVDIVNMKERISLLPDLRKNSMEALRLNPEIYGAWHLLGRWNYRVSNMTIQEKLAYNRQFGSLPNNASYDYATRCFKNALEKKEDVIVFHYDLARAYYALGARPQTREACMRCLNLNNVFPEDPYYKSECANLLQSVSN